MTKIKSKPKFNAKTAKDCVILIVVGIVLLFVMESCLGGDDKHIINAPKLEQIEKPLTMEEKFKKDFMIDDDKCPSMDLYIKKNMNLRDPESYQHIKTVFFSQSDTIVVMIRFRSKNGFGGYEEGIVKSDIKNGKILDAEFMNL